MIYRLQLGYDVPFEDLVVHPERYCEAVEIVLRDTRFTGHLLWPSEKRESLELIVEGDDDPEALAESVSDRTAAAAVLVQTIGEVPVELAGASGWEQHQEILRMALEGEEERCGRCQGLHDPPCPYDLGQEGRGVLPPGPWPYFNLPGTMRHVALSEESFEEQQSQQAEMEHG